MEKSLHKSREKSMEDTTKYPRSILERKPGKSPEEISEKILEEFLKESQEEYLQKT